MATIKVIKKVIGIPSIDVAVSPMTLDSGMPQVYASIAAHGPISSDIVGSLRFSTAEARDLARRLTETADAADALAAHGPAKTKVCSPCCGTEVGRVKTPMYCSEACCDAGRPVNPAPAAAATPTTGPAKEGR